MANVSVYNMEGKEVGTIELNDAVFGVEVNDAPGAYRPHAVWWLSDCR